MNIRAVFLRKLSLSTRLTLLAAATLCPVAALTIYSYWEERGDRRDEAVSRVQSDARGLATNFNLFARDLDSLSRAAALALGNQERPITPENDEDYLADLGAANELFRAVFVTDLDGRVIAQDKTDNIGLDLSSRPYIQALQGGRESVWTGGIEGIRTGELTVAFARVIRTSGGEPRGYLVFAFYPINLRDRFQPGLDTQGHIVLFDQDGKLLFSSEGAADGEGFSSWGPLRTALDGRLANFEGMDTPFDDDQRYGALVPLPALGWAVGYSRSQEALEASLSESLARDLALLALIGAASIAALLLVARQVSRPLTELAGAVTNLKEGQPLELPPLGSDPHVAKLGRALQDMSEAVREREAELAEHAKMLATLEQVGAWLASDLDFQKTVQAITDAGTQVTDAAFGAFFYNVAGDDGQSHSLFALSGAPREAFEGFPMPRATKVFGPTFRGEETVRVDDITRDPRYGKNAPYRGMPKGHLDVRSYLAVPVTSAEGGAVGGLFFGHPEPGVFTQRHEQLAEGLASWAAIALDNARLYKDSQEIQEELTRANRAKDEFLGLVSHELRTPITIILGGAHHLSSNLESLTPEQRKETLADILDSGLRLSQLVQNLLVLARFDGQKEIESEPVLVDKVVESVVAQQERRRPDREVNVVVDTDDRIVLASKLYLEQVIGNLVSNADKYSPPDQPIEVRVSSSGDQVLVDVTDHGRGLSEEDSDRIFEPYYRGAEARRTASGFGLGLAVSRRLAETMGGKLTFRNADGGGAEFTLSLPRCALSPEGTPEEPSATAELV